MSRERDLPCGGKLWIGEEAALPKGIVIICPGGGYEWLSPREAVPVANAFWRGGWMGAVLYYAVGHKLGTMPLEQLGAAVSLMREEYPGLPVVACGFSAGGHLAASLGVHWKTLGLSRPDALVLGYPVITVGDYAHHGSIKNLAGDGETDFFSLECHVTPDMPPAFVWHTASDPEVPVQNSLMLAEAMAEVGVPFELIIFPEGVHGLSLATPEVEQPEKNRFADKRISEWFRLCLEWLDKFKSSK